MRAISDIGLHTVISALVRCACGHPLWALLILTMFGCSRPVQSNSAMPSFAPSADAPWAVDPIWNDGLAEYAVYDAVRTIYGIDRPYEARIITNKQAMDPKTMVKSTDRRARGQVEVFKHNVSEIIPTENYDYRYLTTAFVRTDTLRVFRLTMSSQEDCGTTFKNVSVQRSRMRADSFVYFPGAGVTSRSLQMSDDIHFHDALTLVLRSFPFDDQPNAEYGLRLVPEQTDSHESSIDPVRASVSNLGIELLHLPIGEIRAHHLRVSVHAESIPAQNAVSDYWFAADSGPDWLNMLVKFEGPFGVGYELKTKRRWAYWQRP